jgi:hypothetical protein
MNDKTKGGVHWRFWIFAAVALIWNGLGVVNFFVQMNPDALSSYRESERAIIDGRPAWATVAFAIAVFGGTLGGLLLLLRKSAAYYLFIASLVGVMGTMIHSLLVGSTVGFGLPEILGVILMPSAVGVYFLWYTKRALNKGWIR